MTTLSRLPSLVNDRFGGFMDDLLEIPENWKGWYPSVDIKESNQEYTFLLEVPGMRKEDITVELTGDVLTVSGTRQENMEKDFNGYIRRERKYGHFQRSFRLENPAKADQIDADYKQGVLTVRIPKTGAAEKTQISIK